MKKASIVLFLLTIGFMSAQSFKLGATANIHRSSIVHVHDVSKPAWGGGVGVFGEIPIVDNDIFDSAWLYLVPQLEFSMQGENAQPYSNKDKQQFPNYYLGVPVYVKYFFHRSGWKSDLFLMAGPRFEFLVYNDRKGPEGYAMYAGQEDKINSFGYGLSVGAGLRVQDDWEIFVRFDRGFSKIYPDYDAANKTSTYNRLLGLGVNYYIKSFD
ncbi:outer membrane beta-barrel protein [Soonwooa sp.]|uniref:outer membrane beta-barrel protein n=1 Tax=Soonwooa sp. TaxID=1938592 RepID=UPI0028A01A94|nr:outer membrane beta-barrel protein [Soonwooa sp.]